MPYILTSIARIKIGKKIKQIRKQKKLSQVEVAVDAGINPSYYSKIERGEVNPSLKIFYSIAKSLGVKSSDILSF
ncbi:MAG: helix-turn-helix transcriptional regulator [Candidatus Woesebacteria bacterium]|nr:helix-turn-helix transcriptional regulator [Candidatus Woesebacteria bacterium]